MTMNMNINNTTNEHTCEMCGQVIDIDDVEYIGEHIVCSECYEHAYICEYCGNLTDDREYPAYETERYGEICQDCFDEFYTTCDECGEHVYYGDTCTAYRNGFEVIVCEHCLRNYYAYCEGCGTHYHDSDLNWHERDHRYYCDDCYPRESEYIYDYSYKPDPIFYGAQGELFMGVELEIDNGKDILSCAEELSNIGEIYLKEDGSLDYGFEIVSHPCTLAYHKTLWDDIVSIAKKHKFSSHDAKTCGLHVHLDREYFGKDVATQNYNIGKLILLVNKHWNNVEKFSRRTAYQLSKWAQRVELEADKTETPMSMGLKVEDKKGNRYVAVNLNNHATVEIRIFNGTLKIESIYATLEFCQNLVDASKNWSIADVNKSTFGDIVSVNTTEYLTEYCVSRGIDLGDKGIDIIKRCHSRLENKWIIKRGDLIHVSPESHFARNYAVSYAVCDGWFRVTSAEQGPHQTWVRGITPYAFRNAIPGEYMNIASLKYSDIDIVSRETGEKRLAILERLIEII